MGPSRVGVSLPSPKDENRSSFFVFYFFRILDDEESPQTQWLCSYASDYSLHAIFWGGINIVLIKGEKEKLTRYPRFSAKSVWVFLNRYWSAVINEVMVTKCYPPSVNWSESLAYEFGSRWRGWDYVTLCRSQSSSSSPQPPTSIWGFCHGLTRMHNKEGLKFVGRDFRD
jgi:hypothetical protein